MSAVGSILTNTGALQALNSIANTSNTNNNLQSQLSSGLVHQLACGQPRRLHHRTGLHLAVERSDPGDLQRQPGRQPVANGAGRHHATNRGRAAAQLHRRAGRQRHANLGGVAISAKRRFSSSPARFRRLPIRHSSTTSACSMVVFRACSSRLAPMKARRSRSRSATCQPAPLA